MQNKGFFRRGRILLRRKPWSDNRFVFASLTFSRPKGRGIKPFDTTYFGKLSTGRSEKMKSSLSFCPSLVVITTQNSKYFKF